MKSRRIKPWGGNERKDNVPIEIAPTLLDHAKVTQIGVSGTLRFKFRYDICKADLAILYKHSVTLLSQVQRGICISDPPNAFRSSKKLQ